MKALGAAALAALLAASLASAAHAQGAAKWGDPAKVLRTAIVIAETGFDPQAAADFYSNTINSAIFDPLYEYDYLARPHRIAKKLRQRVGQLAGATQHAWHIGTDFDVVLPRLAMRVQHVIKAGELANLGRVHAEELA